MLSDGRVWLQFGGSPGHYAIEAATDVPTNAIGWIELTNLVSTTAVFEYTDPQANPKRRFYRAKLLSP
jgi:hypothetical protein